MGVVTEVGIHLENVLIVVRQGPLESFDVGGTQSEFACTFVDKQTGSKLIRHQHLHDACCTVGRSVVDDEDMETLVEGEYRTNDLLDILLLVIGRYDDNTVAFVHNWL